MASTTFGERRLDCSQHDNSDALHRAYGLILLADPMLTRGQWATLGQYYRKCSPKHAGLIMIEDSRGYAHAVFRYVIDATPPILRQELFDTKSTRILRLYDLVIVHFPGRGPECAVSQSAERIAQAHRCGLISLDLVGAKAQVANATKFLELGYRFRGIGTLVRQVNQQQSNNAEEQP